MIYLFALCAVTQPIKLFLNKNVNKIIKIIVN